MSARLFMILTSGPGSPPSQRCAGNTGRTSAEHSTGRVPRDSSSAVRV